MNIKCNKCGWEPLPGEFLGVDTIEKNTFTCTCPCCRDILFVYMDSWKACDRSSISPPKISAGTTYLNLDTGQIFGYTKDHGWEERDNHNDKSFFFVNGGDGFAKLNPDWTATKLDDEKPNNICVECEHCKFLEIDNLQIPFCKVSTNPIYGNIVTCESIRPIGKYEPCYEFKKKGE